MNTELTINSNNITFDEHLTALTKAAYILKAQRPYAKELDLWDVINGAWVIMAEKNTITKLIDRDQKYGLLTACIRAGKTYINRTYKIKTGTHRPDLSFLGISIYGEDGLAFDPSDDTPTAEITTGTSELFEYVVDIARRVLTVNEYRTLELYYMQGLTQADVSHCLGLRSRGGTSDRLKLAIQKIRNELNRTTNLLENI